MPPITKLDLISEAYIEAGIFDAGETLPSDDSIFGSSKLTRLLDSMTANEQFIFSKNFFQFTLVPNVQPLSIGQAALITKAQLNSGIALFTAKNDFKAGQAADISGCSPAAFNVTNAQVVAATANSFQVNITGQSDVALSNQPATAMAVYSGAPAPNFAMATQRPAKIISANIILNNVTPAVRIPLNVRDDDWWAGQTVQQVTSTIPTDLYYSADFPNGNIYLWPKQTQAYALEIEAWLNLSDIADLTYPFYLPQGYRDAVTWSLAESLIASYDVPAVKAQAIIREAQKARGRIATLNSSSPRIRTRDDGIPSGGGGGYFNWLSGRSV